VGVRPIGEGHNGRGKVTNFLEHGTPGAETKPLRDLRQIPAAMIADDEQRVGVEFPWRRLYDAWPAVAIYPGIALCGLCRFDSHCH